MLASGLYLSEASLNINTGRCAKHVKLSLGTDAVPASAEPDGSESVNRKRILSMNFSNYTFQTLFLDCITNRSPDSSSSAFPECHGQCSPQHRIGLVSEQQLKSPKAMCALQYGNSAMIQSLMVTGAFCQSAVPSDTDP
eukprot:979103-Amphidinium_carterae.4